MELEKGRVKWFSEEKGFGFIERSQGKDVFVHQTAITGTGRTVLREKDRVEFCVKQGPKGWQAENVTVLDDA